MKLQWLCIFLFVCLLSGSVIAAESDVLTTSNPPASDICENKYAMNVELCGQTISSADFFQRCQDDPTFCSPGNKNTTAVKPATSAVLSEAEDELDEDVVIEDELDEEVDTEDEVDEEVVTTSAAPKSAVVSKAEDEIDEDVDTEDEVDEEVVTTSAAPKSAVVSKTEDELDEDVDTEDEVDEEVVTTSAAPKSAVVSDTEDELDEEVDTEDELDEETVVKEPEPEPVDYSIEAQLPAAVAELGENWSAADVEDAMETIFQNVDGVAMVYIINPDGVIEAVYPDEYSAAIGDFVGRLPVGGILMKARELTTTDEYTSPREKITGYDVIQPIISSDDEYLGAIVVKFSS